jgi:hypothetical protein
LEIYFIGGVNPAFQRRPVAARQFFVGKEIYITGRAAALPSNRYYFALNHCAVTEEPRNFARFFVGKEIYITGRACALPSNEDLSLCASSSLARKFILLAGLAPCPPIKELREMVRGNDVSSTEPRGSAVANRQQTAPKKTGQKLSPNRNAESGKDDP